MTSKKWLQGRFNLEEQLLSLKHVTDTLLISNTTFQYAAYFSPLLRVVQSCQAWRCLPKKGVMRDKTTKQLQNKLKILTSPLSILFCSLNALQFVSLQRSKIFVIFFTKTRSFL